MAAGCSGDAPSVRPVVGNHRLYRGNALRALERHFLSGGVSYIFDVLCNDQNMSRSETYHKLFFHFAWAAKHRLPMLTPALAKNIRAFMVAKCEQLHYGLIAINSMPDHIHLLITLRPTEAIATVAKMLKGSSSHFANHKNQHIHHASGTLQAEFEQFENNLSEPESQ
jgi:REP element-mobilizing transposase RayT